jgi:hypothetical protein
MRQKKRASHMNTLYKFAKQVTLDDRSHKMDITSRRPLSRIEHNGSFLVS